MKPVYFLFSIMFLTVSLLNAQQGNSLSNKVSKEVEILKMADLNLSDVQITRITSILVAEEKLLEKNMEAVKGNTSVLEIRISELKKNKIKNIKGGLTEAQIQKFDAMKLENKF